MLPLEALAHNQAGKCQALVFYFASVTFFGANFFLRPARLRRSTESTCLLSALSNFHRVQHLITVA